MWSGALRRSGTLHHQGKKKHEPAVTTRIRIKTRLRAVASTVSSGAAVDTLHFNTFQGRAFFLATTCSMTHLLLSS